MKNCLRLRILFQFDEFFSNFEKNIYYYFLDSGGIRNKGYIDASSTKPIKTEGTDDFDFLLQQARAGIVRK